MPLPVHARPRPNAARAAVLVAGAAVTLGLGTGLASAAWAHDGLESSSPAAGSQLADVPSEVELGFSGDLVSAAVEVVDGCGRTVPSTATSDDTTIRADLQPQEQADGRGGWVVRWSTLGGDGHPVLGELTFSVVGAPDCGTSGASGASDDTGAPAQAGADRDEQATAPAPGEVAGGPTVTGPAAVASTGPGGSTPTGALLAGGVVIAAGAWVVGDRRHRGRPDRTPGPRS